MPNSKETSLSFSIKDKNLLYKTYMPFVKNGGLFIPVKQDYLLHDEISIRLKILDSEEVFQVIGKVVWVNPVGALGRRPKGVGVQFVNRNKKLITTIEHILNTVENTEQDTFTL